MTGRALQRCGGVHLYTQHRELANQRWRYAGSAFDSYQAVELVTASALRTVVVTTGTLDFSFRRLLDRLRAVLPARVQVIAQAGCDSGRLDWPGARVSATMAPDTLGSLMRAADVVVAHAGIGSALMAFEAGKSPILVPRRKRHGEHVDDHQEQIARKFARSGLAVAAEASSIGPEHFEQVLRRRVERAREQDRFALDERVADGPAGLPLRPQHRARGRHGHGHLNAGRGAPRCRASVGGRHLAAGGLAPGLGPLDAARRRVRPAPAPRRCRARSHLRGRLVRAQGSDPGGGQIAPSCAEHPRPRFLWLRGAPPASRALGPQPGERDHGAERRGPAARARARSRRPFRVPAFSPVPARPAPVPASATAELVLFAGEVGLRKGADVLSRAWPAVAHARPTARCVMVGPATDLRIEDRERLQVRGAVDAAELRRLLCEARVVALPSRGEALPMILLEAMAAKHATVRRNPCRGIGALRGCGLIVPAGDHEALAAALIEVRWIILQRAGSLAARGQELCRRRMDPQAVAVLLGRLYREPDAGASPSACAIPSRLGSGRGRGAPGQQRPTVRRGTIA